MKVIQKILFPVFLVLLICLTESWSKPRIPGLLYIPTADILPHGHFNLSAHLNFFNSYNFGVDTTAEMQYPFSGGLVLGLQDKAQFGMQFGDEASFSFRAYVYEASGTDFVPDVVIGIRSLFASQEARLFGVRDKDLSTGLRNEAYVALSGNVGDLTRFHLGGNAAAGSNENLANAFLGLEQYVGANLYLGYEVFQRQKSFHHHATVVYKFQSYFSLSAGLSELQSWLYQGGEWGFFTSPENPVPDGYDSPGVRVSLSIGGWAIKSGRKSESTRLRDVEKKQLALADTIIKMDRHLKDMEKSLDKLLSKKDRAWQIQNNQVGDYLDMIKKRINSDIPFDPKEIADIQNKILNLRGAGRTVLKKLAINPASDDEHRAQACIIMGMSKRGEFIEPLLKATADPEAKVRREAILALGKMGARVAVDFAQALLDDADETVQLAAREAIRLIKERHGEEESGPQEPEAP